MKWIAKKDFYRTPELAEVEITGGCKGAPKTVKLDNDKSPLHEKQVSSLHELHIHKGATFELGSSRNESELRTGKDPKRNLIAQLRYSGCISDANDVDCVKRIEEEIETDRKRNETVAKAQKQVIGSDLVEAILQAIKTMSAPVAEPKK